MSDKPYRVVLGTRRCPDEIVGPSAPQTGFDPDETSRRFTLVADLNAAYAAGLAAHALDHSRLIAAARAVCESFPHEIFGKDNRDALRIVGDIIQLRAALAELEGK